MDLYKFNVMFRPAIKFVYICIAKHDYVRTRVVEKIEKHTFMILMYS